MVIKFDIHVTSQQGGHFKKNRRSSYPVRVVHFYSSVALKMKHLNSVLSAILIMEIISKLDNAKTAN